MTGIPLAVGIALLAGGELFDGESSSPAVSPQTIQQWIDELASPVFATRERACEALFTTGLPAFDALMEAAHSDELEAVYRTKRILSRMAANDVQVLDALSRIADSETAIAVVAAQVLVSPKVQAALRSKIRAKIRARVEKELDEFFGQLRHELKKGNLEDARQIAANAVEAEQSGKAPHYSAALLSLEVEIAELELAKKSGRAEVQSRLDSLTREREKKTAGYLLSRAHAAIDEKRFDDAREYALAAEKLNVVYGLFEDRPELVLQTINRMENAPPPDSQ